MRAILLGIVLGLACGLAGCHSEAEKPDANYAAYLDLVGKQAASEEAARTAFSQMAAKCTGDTCVQTVAAIAGLTLAAYGSHAAPPQQFAQRDSFVERALLAGIGQAGPVGQAIVAYKQVVANRDVSLAQYSFLGGAVHDVATATAAAAPSITVGRDYITGSVDNGTHVTGDLTNGNKTTTSIDNSGVYNTGTLDRYQSPSDDHSASGAGCTGSTTCQTQPPASTTGTP